MGVKKVLGRSTLAVLLVLPSLFLAPLRAVSASPGGVVESWTTVTDLGVSLHDLVIDGDSMWATIPSENRVVELSTSDLAERRRILVGTDPRGIDVLGDGTLVVALHGATGYVEVDPTDESLHAVTLPLLGTPDAWDVLAYGDLVVVAAETGSKLVRVDRSNGWSSSTVAGRGYLGSRPRLAAAGESIIVGTGYSPNSLYRLDATDPTMPIVAEDDHGVVGGTQLLAVLSNGNWSQIGSGQVVRNADMVPIGLVAPGMPVAHSDPSIAYSVSGTELIGRETDRFSGVARHDISGCGLGGASIVAAAMPDAGTLIVAAGSRVCRVDVGLAPNEVQPQPSPSPVEAAPGIDTIDLGSGVHDVTMGGDSLWASLPSESRIVELSPWSLHEHRRVVVASQPRGLDVADDGTVAVASYGATGYVEFDPDTDEVRPITVPAIGHPETWDVETIGETVVVSSNPGSSGSSRLVRVDRADGWSSSVVANGKTIRAGPVFARRGSTVLVGEGFSPNSLYRLDGDDPSLPVVAEDRHGNVNGTQRLAVSWDGGLAHLGSGQIVRTSDITAVGSVTAGFPASDPTGGLAYSVDPGAIAVHETATYSLLGYKDITACGFAPGNAIEAVETLANRTLVIAGGSRICRVELFEFAGPPGPGEAGTIIGGIYRLDLWYRAPVDDGGSPITEVQIELDGPTPMVRSVPVDGGEEIFEDLERGEYRGRLRGRNEHGWGPWSSWSEVAQVTRHRLGFKGEDRFVNGDYLPVSGDFDGDGSSDLLWYGPGTGADYLWTSRGDGSFSSRSVRIDGTYTPVEGDFDGDGASDVLWYRPGPGADYLWLSRGDGSFSSRSVRIDGTYTPVEGDFDGDGASDVLWYRPGTGADYFWMSDADGSFTSTPTQINGVYLPAPGDYDGDGASDVLWYRPGTGTDFLWTSKGDGSFASAPTRIDGDYVPVVGDFDGDGTADIIWYAEGPGSDHLWRNNGDGTFESSATRLYGSYIPATGDFDGNGLTDVFWHWPGPGTDQLWLARLLP